jgi:hypothetical protein
MNRNAIIAIGLVAALGVPSLARNPKQEKGETVTVGEITSIDAEKKTFEVRSRTLGVVVTRSPRRVSGTLGEHVPLEDPRRRLPGEPFPATSQPTTRPSPRRPDPGYTTTLFLTDDETAFSFDDEEVSFGQLEVGQRVKVTAKPAENGGLATKVDRSS